MTQQIYSLAYQPKEFFQLGALLASWATDEYIFASYPIICQQNGRIYFLVVFGYCPTDSGNTALFAWDSGNKEFLYWNEEDPEFNLDVPLMDAAELSNGYSCENLEILTKWVLTGE